MKPQQLNLFTGNHISQDILEYWEEAAKRDLRIKKPIVMISIKETLTCE